MNETSQAIAAVKREVQRSEWQRQIQERQEQCRTVDEWFISLGDKQGHVLPSAQEGAEIYVSKHGGYLF